MADVLKLTFLSATNDKISLNVRYPNKSLDDAQVGAAMEQIISSGVVRINNTAPVANIGAELQTITETPYSI